MLSQHPCIGKVTANYGVEGHFKACLDRKFGELAWMKRRLRLKHHIDDIGTLVTLLQEEHDRMKAARPSLAS
eukprot:2371021-Prorocentrum_lima.AAC.1